MTLPKILNPIPIAPYTPTYSAGYTVNHNAGVRCYLRYEKYLNN